MTEEIQLLVQICTIQYKNIPSSLSNNSYNDGVFGGHSLGAARLVREAFMQQDRHYVPHPHSDILIHDLSIDQFRNGLEHVCLPSNAARL